MTFFSSRVIGAFFEGTAAVVDAMGMSPGVVAPHALGGACGGMSRRGLTAF